ncbi:MAG: hypothetical protein KH299_08820, partial [Firmicutes bacterium]|nr:hypothetical protein [Bacillota bacterium]
DDERSKQRQRRQTDNGCVFFVFHKYLQLSLRQNVSGCNASLFFGRIAQPAACLQLSRHTAQKSSETRQGSLRLLLV